MTEPPITRTEVVERLAEIARDGRGIAQMQALKTLLGLPELEETREPNALDELRERYQARRRGPPTPGTGIVRTRRVDPRIGGRRPRTWANAALRVSALWRTV
jgi:hypothetical protein